MRLKEFELQEINIARKGAPEVKGTWKSAAAGNYIAVGVRAGKKYQLKLRTRPVWVDIEGDIAKLKARIAAETDDEAVKRLRAELKQKEDKRKMHQANNCLSDEFVEAKNAIFRRVNGIGKPDLFSCSAELWKEEMSEVSIGTRCLEAAPWFTMDIPIFADGSRPISFQNLSLDEKYDLIADLAQNLQTLHDAGVVHCDLKEGNTIIVKVGDKRHVAIIDFDNAFILDELTAHRRKYSYDTWDLILGGTYRSPEFHTFREDVTYIDEMDCDFGDLKADKLTTKIDVYALAFTIWEYFFGNIVEHPMPFYSDDGKPVDGVNPNNYAALVAEDGYRLRLPAEEGDTGVNDLLYAMLNWMLELEPADRPDARTVAEVFRTRSLAKVPAKYKRVDHFSLPETADVELVPISGITVEWMPNKAGEYDGTLFCVCNRGSKMYLHSTKELVVRGYARPKGGAAPAASVAVASAVDSTDEPWEGDAIGVKLPQCIRRADVKGKYILSSGSSAEVVDVYKLKRMGFFCDEAASHTFWPQDATDRFLPRLEVRPGYMITRDFDKGVSHYIVTPKGRAGIVERLRYDQLEARRRAYRAGSAPTVTAESPAPAASAKPAEPVLGKPNPADRIVFLKENMHGVASIRRSPNPSNRGKYLVCMEGEKTAILMTVEELKAKKYAKSIDEE